MAHQDRSHEDTSHLAFVVDGPRSGEIRRLPVAGERSGSALARGSDTALVRVEACALSGTDGEQWAGHLRAPWPHVPGSEVVGVIETIGGQAAERLGVRPGSRVVVAPRRWCGSCPSCRQGRVRRCEQFALSASVGQACLGADDGAATFGGFGQLLALGPGSWVVPVPTGLDPVVASAANAVAEAIRWVNHVGGVAEGDIVAVLGPGLRGLAAAAMARDAGARFVAVIGHGRRDEQRLGLATLFGADLTIDAATSDPVAVLHEATGSGADVVLDITSSAPAAFAAAIALAAPEGRVVVAGVHGEGAVDGFSPDDIVVRQLRVTGAIGCGPGDHARALEVLAAHRWPFASVPVALFDLSRAAEALDTVTPSTSRDPASPIRTVAVPGNGLTDSGGVP